MRRIQALCGIATQLENAGVTEAAVLLDAGVAMLSGKSMTPADYNLAEAADLVETELQQFLDSYKTVASQQEGVVLIAGMAATSASTMIDALKELVYNIENKEMDLKSIATVIALTEAYEVLNANAKD